MKILFAVPKPLQNNKEKNEVLTAQNVLLQLKITMQLKIDATESRKESQLKFLFYTGHN